MEKDGQHSSTPPARIKQSDVSRVRIMAMAATGASLKDISEQTGISVPGVSRILQPADSQEQLAEVIQGMNAELQAKLPEITRETLSRLSELLQYRYLGTDQQLKTIQIALNVTMRLTDAYSD